jgi:hypothetical protein
MDKSIEYIKMVDNPWIQNCWKIQEGDIVVRIVTQKVVPQSFPMKYYMEDIPYNELGKPRMYHHEIGDLISSNEVGINPQWHYIWMPTIGQLIEMVRGWFGGERLKRGLVERDINIEGRFHYWIESDNGYSIEFLNNSTFEQLWLAFLMKEKYGRVWDGEKWV